MINERTLEQSEARVEQERVDTLRRLSADMEQLGAAHCDDCGVIIPEERRKAAPWSRRCVNCQTKFERHHR